MSREDNAFLSRLQELAGTNIAEFARNLGLKQSVVHRYVTGSMRPGYEFFRRLDAANINLNWLFSGRGSPYLSSSTTEGSKLALEIEGMDRTGQTLVREFVTTYRRLARARKKR